MFSETSTIIKKDIFWKVKDSETQAALTDKVSFTIFFSVHLSQTN